MAASFKAVSRKLGRTLKQVATQRSWGILGALVGATVGSVLLKRSRSPDAPSDALPLAARAPTASSELVPAPTGEMTPPHGDPLVHGVSKPPRTKKRSRTPPASKRSTQARQMSDADVALQSSAASASERESVLAPPPPPAKGSKRTRSAHAPRRIRSHPSK